MIKIILAVFMLCLSGISNAREECAVVDGETYLALPQEGEQLQHGPNRIRKGQWYEVGKIQDGWIAVNADGEFAWARASIFAYSCQPLAGVPNNYASTQEPKKQELKKAQASGASSKASAPKKASSHAGGCACGSGRVCIGPRGGRYCITSGGNKRYGG